MALLLRKGHIRSPAATLVRGLEANYPFDEASGCRLDRLSKGPGVAPLFVRSTTKHLDCNDNADLSIGTGKDVTWAGWVYVTALPGATMTVLSKFNTTDNNREYGINIVVNVATPVFQFIVSADGIATTAVTMAAVAANQVATGTWYFVVAQYDATNNVAKIAFNGGDFTTATHAGGIFDGTAVFHFGGAQTAGTTQAFDGRTKCWGLWKTAAGGGGLLTTAQINALWNNGLPRLHRTLDLAERVGLVAYWDQGEISGTRADSVGSNNLTDNTVTFATSVGLSLADVNTVTSVAGKLGNAAVFTLANSEQLVGGDIHRSSDTDWEWNGWAYLAAKATDQVILAKLTGAGTSEYELYYDTSSDRFRWTVYDGTNSIGTIDADTLGAVSTATWYFVRVWHSATDNQVGIAVNNGASDTAATTGAASSGTTAVFRFGANGSGSPNYLGGRLDDWARYSRILTAGEATARYNAGAGLAYPFTS